MLAGRATACLRAARRAFFPLSFFPLALGRALVYV